MSDDLDGTDPGDGPGGDDEALRALIALAAAGELDDDDRAEVERLIAGRPALVAEYRDLRATASIPRAGGDRDASGDGEGAGVAEPVADAPPPAASVPPPAAARRPRRVPGWWLPVVCALGAGAIVIVAAVLVRKDSDDSPPANRADEVLDDPDHAVLPFGGDLSGLSLIVSADADAAVLSGSGIAAPEGSDVYVLWLDHDGETTRLHEFRPDDSGVVDVVLPGVSVGDGDRLVVTVEPAGDVAGSAVPGG